MLVSVKNSGGSVFAQGREPADLHERDGDGHEDETREQDDPLDRIRVDHGLESADHGVQHGDDGDDHEGERPRLHSEHRLADHGGRGERGSGLDLAAGEAEVADPGDDGGEQRDRVVVSKAQEVRICEHLLLGIDPLDPRNDEHGCEPGADETREEKPRSRQAHEEADASESDRETAAHIGGDDREADVMGPDVATADVVVLGALVSPEVVETDGKDAEQVDDEDRVVDEVHTSLPCSIPRGIATGHRGVPGAVCNAGLHEAAARDRTVVGFALRRPRGAREHRRPSGHV
jgi:hypothetical protein